MMETTRESYKPLFDRCVIAIALLVLLPLWALLLVAMPLAIRLESRGPALYCQKRLGQGGRTFTLWKFRTMVDGAERDIGPVWAARRDARVTRVGQVLRRWHLDELPQLVNVARGEMSLVGPRPERPELAAQVERGLPGFSRRLAVRPGIAGLAQARGAGHRNPRAKLQYDLEYISRMGPWLDLRLCLECVWLVLRRQLQSLRAGRKRPSPLPHGSASQGSPMPRRTPAAVLSPRPLDAPPEPVQPPVLELRRRGLPREGQHHARRQQRACGAFHATLEPGRFARNPCDGNSKAAEATVAAPRRQTQRTIGGNQYRRLHGNHAHLAPEFAQAARATCCTETTVGGLEGQGAGRRAT